jgi:methanogenic corrinoid protein MtbC1
MVADIFELNGWDTYYIGANTPAEAVSEAITDRRAEVLAVSVTLTPHLSQARQLIDGVRQSLGSDLVILAGGPPFNVAPDLFRRIGADGTAPDAWAAVKEAERLVGTAA